MGYLDCFDFGGACDDSHVTAPEDSPHNAGRKSRGVCKREKKKDKSRIAPQVRALQIEVETVKKQLQNLQIEVEAVKKQLQNLGEQNHENLQCQLSFNECTLRRLEHVFPAQSNSQDSRIQNLVEEQQKALSAEMQSLTHGREVAVANLNAITNMHCEFNERLKAEAEKINQIEQACKASIYHMHLRHHEHLKTQSEKLNTLQKEMHALQQGCNSASQTNFEQFVKYFNESS